MGVMSRLLNWLNSTGLYRQFQFSISFLQNSVMITCFVISPFWDGGLSNRNSRWRKMARAHIFDPEFVVLYNDMDEFHYHAFSETRSKIPFWI